ncbi:hypothetical protein [Hydrogenivirga sp.]
MEVLMKNKSSLEMTLLEELTQLEYFMVKKPMSSPEFWTEWQEKYGKATLAKVALKKIARTKKLAQGEYAKLRTMVRVYEDVIRYLEQLKNTALSVRGVVTNFNVELDDEDIDLDF